MKRVQPSRELIEANSFPEPNTGCWLWTGRVNQQGYGRLGRGRAHRISYQLFNGQIPAGHHICHRCDQPGCVNPAHLFAGTRLENMRDCARKGRLFVQRNPEKSPRDLLSTQAVEHIRKTFRPRHPEFGGIALANLYGVSPSVISKVVRHNTWGADRLAKIAERKKALRTTAGGGR